MITLDKNNKPISKEIDKDRELLPAWRKNAPIPVKKDNRVILDKTLYKKIDKNKYYNLKTGVVEIWNL